MLDTILAWFTEPTLQGWSVRLLHVCAVGQTLFVLLWATLRWWQRWVGRALMVKSVALALFLDTALVNYYLPPYPHEQLVGTLEFALVAAGICSQLLVLAFELVRARRRHRAVVTS